MTGIRKAWYAVVNALYGVGGICVPEISGTAAVGVTDDSPATESYSVYPKSGSGQYAYEWSNGATTQTTTYTLWPNATKTDYYVRIWVNVTDLGASHIPETRVLDVFVNCTPPPDDRDCEIDGC